MLNNPLPLEKALIRLATERASFPNTKIDYSLQYSGLLQHLRANLYDQIDSGLSANTEEHGLYTAHNAEHFDEVVLYAGELLGVKEDGSGEIGLKPYELYVLLVAIRIHDAGNIHGRLDHEKKCFSVLRNCGAAAGDDDTEKKIIGDIAQAHGGKTASGDKDTIGTLNKNTGISRHAIRARLLASIVRFADEICESRRRASNYLIKYGTMPKHSELFHRYASAITESSIARTERRVSLKFTVNVKDAAKPWGCANSGEKTESFLIDEIFERLEKMDRERQYCNRYSRELYTIDSIRASIDIINDEHELIHQIPIPELTDVGYPEGNPNRIKATLSQYCGPDYWKSFNLDSEAR